MIKGTYGFMEGSSLFYVTTLPGIVVVEIKRFNLLRDLT